MVSVFRRVRPQFGASPWPLAGFLLASWLLAGFKPPHKDFSRKSGFKGLAKLVHSLHENTCVSMVSVFRGVPPIWGLFLASCWPPGLLLASCWLLADLLLASCWPLASFLLASCWPLAGFLLPFAGLLLASCWSLAGLLLASCWPLAGLLLASCWPLAGLLLAPCWPLAGLLLASCWLLAGLLLASCWGSGLGGTKSLPVFRVQGLCVHVGLKAFGLGFRVYPARARARA